MLLLEFTQSSGRNRESLIPRRRAKPRAIPHRWCEKAVRMGTLHIAFDAFGTEHSAVKRKILPWLESDHLVFTDFELNSTLLPAEAAVCLDEFLRRIACLALPSSGRLVFRMRAIALNKQLFIDRQPCHHRFLKRSWLVANALRLQDGHTCCHVPDDAIR